MKLVILLLTFSYCSGDLTFTHFKLEYQAIRKVTPKFWTKYIEMFLFRCLKHNQLKHGYSKNILFQLLQYSKYFQKIKERQITTNTLPKENVLVSWPSGIFSIGSTKSFLLKFNLNANLRLNLTFYTIEFNYMLLSCEMASLRIANIEHQMENFFFCARHSTFKFFSGQYSTFNLYPYFKHIGLQVKINIKKQIKFQLEATFSVTDKAFISNTKIKYSEHQVEMSLYPLTYLLGDENFLVTSKIIQAEKHKQIKLMMYGIASAVIDGPGYMIKTLHLTPGRMEYTTSTFQCIIQSFTKPSERAGLVMYEFVELQGRVFTVIKEKSQIKQSLPFNKCLINTCFLEFESSKEFQLNITLLRVETDSHSDITFKGLHFTERVNSGYHDIDTLSTNFNHSISPNWSYSSRDSSIYIVMYWYKGHSEINASMIISQTKCKDVQIDPCIFARCSLRPDFNPKRKGTKCSQYYDDITASVHFDLIPNLDRRRPHFLFSIPKGECINLHIAPKPSHISLAIWRILRYSFFQSYFINGCPFILKSSPGKNRIDEVRGILQASGEFLKLSGSKLSSSVIMKINSKIGKIAASQMSYHTYNGVINNHGQNHFKEIYVLHVNMTWTSKERKWIQVHLKRCRRSRNTGIQFPNCYSSLSYNCC